ncbi:MAG: ATP-binding protein [Candidatus Competibacteraceae bacterium]|jgi:DNA-binding transcriptional ArsR family regulator|nr:ATP-binding protein [Candidatus Competibacteraceae bacterium]
MKKKPDLPLRKFNPGTFQSDQTIIEQFVVRERELGIVLDTLKGNINSPSCQHMLLVGPRGRGKSMLLARVVAELRTNKTLSEQQFPVRFMEESQEVFNIADFWLEALFQLARELGANDPEFSQELKATHEDLVSRWQDKDLGMRALATVLDAADRLGRQLVIVVENLQSLCEDTDEDFGWQLRKTLQAENQIILLASATSHFSGLEDAQEPFFELFQLLCLQPLDTEDCRRLWQAVTGDVVSECSIKPMQILTGGSPRLLVIMADFARHRSLRQLMEELVTLIDGHTEYFRSHMETLAKNERRVYIAVIDLWQPSTTGEIAARARMDVRTVSALLGRLAKRGAVTVEGSGKKRLYAAAERLYSIYYKLRRERDEAAVVSNLIHFMMVLYNPSELAEWSKTLALEAATSPGIRVGIMRAIEEDPRTRDMLSWFLSKADHLAKQTDADHDEMLSFIAEIKTASKNREYEKIIEIVELNPSLSGVNYAHALTWKGTAQLLLDKPAAAIATFREVVMRFGASEDQEAREQVANALVLLGTVLIAIGEPNVAISTAEIIERDFGSSISGDSILFKWFLPWIKTKALVAKKKFPDAMHAFESLYAVFDPSDPDMMQLIQTLVISLIGSGVSSKALLEILNSDEQKCATITPLVVALRQEAGESVRAPAEVLEVATDIRKRMQASR